MKASPAGDRRSPTTSWCAARCDVLEPLYRGENPLEPERVSEKLHANTFWMGRGGSITHAISGIDIALWDILGQGHRAAGRAAARRTISRARAALRVAADARAARAGRTTCAPSAAQGFRAFKIGWGPFGRQSYAMDEAIVRAAREAVGPDSLLMVDAGASDAFWPQDYKWARAHRATCWPSTTSTGSRSRFRPTTCTITCCCANTSPLPIAGGEVLTRRQSFTPWLQQRRLRHRAAGRDQSRRHQRGAAHRLDGARSTASASFRTAGTPRWAWPPICTSPRPVRGTDLVEYLTGSPFIDELSESGWKLDADGMLPIPTQPGLGVSLNMDAVEKYTGVRLAEAPR